jgi:hypothetical protein
VWIHNSKLWGDMCKKTISHLHMSVSRRGKAETPLVGSCKWQAQSPCSTRWGTVVLQTWTRLNHQAQSDRGWSRHLCLAWVQLPRGL